MASDFNTSAVGIFFESLQNLRSYLPDIANKFDGIKNKLENEKCQNLWAFPTSDSISLLDDLNDALAECHILKQHRTSIRKKTNLFSRSEHNTVQNVNNLLSSINGKIKVEESKADSRSSGTQTETNFLIRQNFADVEAGKSIFQLYGEEEKKIIDCLIRRGGFKAIGICGMCGSGKTVLVDKVLKNEKVLEMFCPIIRVCLSDISPKEHGDAKVVKHLLEELNYDVDELTGTNRDAVDLVDVLKRTLMARKFLIVLDDLWFVSGIVKDVPRDSGGAVIVTSRIKHVAEKMADNECLFHLKPWESDARKRLGDVVIEEGELVDRIHGLPYIHGLPLAVKVLKRLFKVQELQQQHTYQNF